ncbi:MAG: carboxymuconolactone decarboxylase family protein [Candidatus Helarchaeota archaeon]
MQGKIKELVAIGASIGANCTACLKHHLRLAREYGIDDAEIKDAIEIALRVRKNSTRTIDKLIEDTIKGIPDNSNEPCCS